MPHVVTLANPRLRQRAIDLIMAAKPNSRVEFKGPKRSNDANAAMWAKLSEIADQLTWHGKRLDTESWKLVFLDALRREHRDEMRLVPNIDGTGWVNISPVHSSDLSEEEMRDLLAIISAFGDSHGVVWSEPKPKDMPPAPPIEAYADMETSNG
jgi:hypothetical protein